MTFSIVGYDPMEKQWGIAVQSKFLGVGAVVPWAKAGAGAVVLHNHMQIHHMALWQHQKGVDTLPFSTLSNLNRKLYKQVYFI
jgi:hypothetical protein